MGFAADAVQLLFAVRALVEPNGFAHVQRHTRGALLAEQAVDALALSIGIDVRDDRTIVFVGHGEGAATEGTNRHVHVPAHRLGEDNDPHLATRKLVERLVVFADPFASLRDGNPALVTQNPGGTTVKMLGKHRDAHIPEPLPSRMHAESVEHEDVVADAYRPVAKLLLVLADNRLALDLQTEMQPVVNRHNQPFHKKG